MRIIGGLARGIQLKSPHEGPGIKPTMDRVREAIFNSQEPIMGKTVVDLFSGSGALGLEAMSRQADRVAWVEQKRSLCKIIEENIKQRRSAAEGAEHLVTEGAQAYTRERRAHEGQTLLRSFRENSEAIQRAELDKALTALGRGADADEVLRSLSRSLTNKLIHQPTVAIRDASANDRGDLLDYLKSLYQLD